MKLFLALGALLTCATAAFPDSVAYITTGSQQFGTVDLTTGSFNLIGTTSGIQLAGLGEINGVIYGGGVGSDTLYRVNTSTGAVSVVGSGNLSYFVFGSTASSLYMVDAGGNLWNVNQTNGAATEIGSTGVLIGGNTVGMSAGDKTLYLSVGSQLYTLNTTNGLATLVGNTGVDTIGGLVSVYGTLYGASDTPPFSVFSLNRSTGAAAHVSDITGASDVTWGLAPIVPEPASFGLMGMAGAALVGASLLRKRKSA
jgi:hypothetical protein